MMQAVHFHTNGIPNYEPMDPKKKRRLRGREKWKLKELQRHVIAAPDENDHLSDDNVPEDKMMPSFYCSLRRVVVLTKSPQKGIPCHAKDNTLSCGDAGDSTPSNPSVTGVVTPTLSPGGTADPNHDSGDSFPKSYFSEPSSILQNGSISANIYELEQLLEYHLSQCALLLDQQKALLTLETEEVIVRDAFNNGMPLTAEVLIKDFLHNKEISQADLNNGTVASEAQNDSCEQVLFRINCGSHNSEDSCEGIEPPAAEMFSDTPLNPSFCDDESALRLSNNDLTRSKSPSPVSLPVPFSPSMLSFTTASDIMDLLRYHAEQAAILEQSKTLFALREEEGLGRRLMEIFWSFRKENSVCKVGQERSALTEKIIEKMEKTTDAVDNGYASDGSVSIDYIWDELEASTSKLAASAELDQSTGGPITTQLFEAAFSVDSTTISHVEDDDYLEEIESMFHPDRSAVSATAETIKKATGNTQSGRIATDPPQQQSAKTANRFSLFNGVFGGTTYIGCSRGDGHKIRPIYASSDYYVQGFGRGAMAMRKPFCGRLDKRPGPVSYQPFIRSLFPHAYHNPYVRSTIATTTAPLPTTSLRVGATPFVPSTHRALDHHLCTGLNSGTVPGSIDPHLNKKDDEKPISALLLVAVQTQKYIRVDPPSTSTTEVKGESKTSLDYLLILTLLDKASNTLMDVWLQIDEREKGANSICSNCIHKELVYKSYINDADTVDDPPLGPNNDGRINLSVPITWQEAIKLSPSEIYSPMPYNGEVSRNTYYDHGTSKCAVSTENGDIAPSFLSALTTMIMKRNRTSEPCQQTILSHEHRQLSDKLTPLRSGRMRVPISYKELVQILSLEKEGLPATDNNNLNDPCPFGTMLQRQFFYIELTARDTFLATERAGRTILRRDRAKGLQDISRGLRDENILKKRIILR
eukprot:Tbor_TRINITY_DN5511_c0_g1::TRINITY_DN5511_c0_g1_i1::g.13646::m.13646